MRHTHSGTERPFFTDEQFERIALEELLAQDLLPSTPEPIRIERFIEKRFHVTPTYEELPPKVLGYTEFGPDGVRAVMVSRQLSEERSRVAERRINTTLAHEAGHGLLHTQLFVLDAFPQDLFENSKDVRPTRILCREEAAPTPTVRPYHGRWWEVQANRMMGALLLPRTLVRTCLEGLLAEGGTLGTPQLPDEARNDAKRRLVEAFDINPIVATIRMDQVYPVRDARQLTL